MTPYQPIGGAQGSTAGTSPLQPAPTGQTATYEDPERRAEREYIARQREQNPPTAMDYGAELATSIVRGLASTTTQGVRSVAEGYEAVRRLLGAEKDEDVRQYAAYRFGQALQDATDEIVPNDPRFRETVFRAVGEGVGSTLSFALPSGAAGKLAKVAKLAPKLVKTAQAVTAGGVGALVGGGSQFEEARAAGASEKDQFLNYLGGAAGGVTEVASIGRLLARFFKAAPVGFKGRLIHALIEGGKGATEEGVQEAVQGTLNNATAKATFEKDRALFEGVGRAGGVGGIVGFLLSAVAGYRHGPTTNKAGEPLGAPPQPQGQPDPLQAQAGGPTLGPPGTELPAPANENIPLPSTRRPVESIPGAPASERGAGGAVNVQGEVPTSAPSATASPDTGRIDSRDFVGPPITESARAPTSSPPVVAPSQPVSAAPGAVDTSGSRPADKKRPVAKGKGKPLPVRVVAPGVPPVVGSEGAPSGAQPGDVAAVTPQRVRPSSIDTPAQGALAQARDMKARVWKNVKRLRESLKSEPLGGNRAGIRLELLKAERSHAEWSRVEREAKAAIESRAAELGQTTLPSAPPVAPPPPPAAKRQITRKELDARLIEMASEKGVIYDRPTDETGERDSRLRSDYTFNDSNQGRQHAKELREALPKHLQRKVHVRKGGDAEDVMFDVGIDAMVQSVVGHAEGRSVETFKALKKMAAEFPDHFTHAELYDISRHEAMTGGSRKDKDAIRKIKPASIDAAQLEPGDSFEVAGQVHKVKGETESGNVRIENDIKTEAAPGQAVVYDSGTLKKGIGGRAKDLLGQNVAPPKIVGKQQGLDLGATTMRGEKLTTTGIIGTSGKLTKLTPDAVPTRSDETSIPDYLRDEDIPGQETLDDSFDFGANAPAETEAGGKGTTDLNSIVAEIGPERSADDKGFLASESGGVEFPTRYVKAPDTLTDPGAAESKDVEDALRRAEGLGNPGMLRRAATAAKQASRDFTRHFVKLEHVDDAPTIDILRRVEAIPEWSKAMAATSVEEITKNLGPKRQRVFSRVLLLNDILKDIDGGLYTGKELPFGYADRAMIERDLRRMKRIAKATPDIQEALDMRERLAGAVTKRLVELDLLPEKVLSDDRYYHRQVLKYFGLREDLKTGVFAKDVRTHTKGFQRTRVGGTDFNTKFKEAEYEWLAHAYSQIATREGLERVRAFNDVRSELENEAKAARQDGKDVTWRDFIPEGYTTWQPERGRHLFRAMSIEERVLEELLSGERTIESEDVREILAMGQKKREWVIPKRVAETLDSLNEFRDTTVIEKAAAKVHGTWKQWVLLNPLRAFKYRFNNQTGDFDVAFAYHPGILLEVPDAFRDLWRTARGKSSAKVREEINRGVQKRVLGSGISIQEIPDVNMLDVYRAFKDDRGFRGPLRYYWDVVTKYNNVFENTTRLAAWRWFNKNLPKSGKRYYGASIRRQMDRLYEEREAGRFTNDEIAAKLATELIGDYGNVSRAGQYTRRHIVPFYSWMEINLPRYVRLFKNAPYEGGSQTRVAATKAVSASAYLAVRAAALYGMILLWNRFMFPEEDDILRRNHGTLHLILGRNADGSIKSLRFQGAFSDALEWFGLGDVVSDVKQVREGSATITDKAAEAAKAPFERIVGGALPVERNIIESFLGVKAGWPQQFGVGAEFDPKSVPIRDRARHVARFWSMDWLYDKVLGRPMPPELRSNPLGQAFLYRTDAGETAHYYIRDKANRWLESQGKEATFHEPTERSNALYYYKQAVRWGDRKAADKWIKEYARLGGTVKGFKQSKRMSAPLGAIAQSKQVDFVKSLNERDRLILKEALKWWDSHSPKLKEAG